MIDWHCHILPGIDDGPNSMDDAVEMAVALHKAGFREVYCTPHLIKGFYDADNITIRKGVVDLQERLDTLCIDLRLHPGREYYLDEYLLDYLKDPMPLGNTSYVLLEVPDHALPENVKETCYRIKCSGFTPVIAHPERCALFALPQKEENGIRKLFNTLGGAFKGSAAHNRLPAAYAGKSLMEYLQEIGCAFQGNLGSFAGMYGEKVKLAAGRLREMGIYSYLGSDLHSAGKITAIARQVEPRMGAVTGGQIQR